MTQKYYTENVLSHYIESIKKARAQEQRPILQEDNNSSHDTRLYNNYTARHKRSHDINSFIHPAQSLDLKSIETH